METLCVSICKVKVYVSNVKRFGTLITMIFTDLIFEAPEVLNSTKKIMIPQLLIIIHNYFQDFFDDHGDLNNSKPAMWSAFICNITHFQLYKQVLQFNIITEKVITKQNVAKYYCNHVMFETTYK